MSKQATLFGAGSDHEKRIHVDAEFEEWWFLWPPWKRIDKKKTRESFVKARKVASYDVLYDGAKKYIAARVAYRDAAPDYRAFGVNSKKEEEHLTRHPKRWLNDESWNNPVDEPPHMAQDRRDKEGRKRREARERQERQAAGIERDRWDRRFATARAVIKRHGDAAAQAAFKQCQKDNRYARFDVFACEIAEILEPYCLSEVK